MAKEERQDLIFQSSPEVVFATNKFIDVPIILQYDDTPLIEVYQEIRAGFTSAFTIYNQDAVKLAVVRGSRIHKTPQGEKAGLSLRHPQGMTVCELGGKPLFEVRRTGAAALKMDAELYAPDGRFLVASDPSLLWHTVSASPGGLIVGGCSFSENTFTGFKIGIWVGSDGSIAAGCSVKPPTPPKPQAP